MQKLQKSFHKIYVNSLIHMLFVPLFMLTIDFIAFWSFLQKILSCYVDSLFYMLENLLLNHGKILTSNGTYRPPY